MTYYYFDCYGILIGSGSEPTTMSTQIEPPTTPTGLLVFNGSVWVDKPDIRGDWYDGYGTLYTIADPNSSIEGLLRIKPITPGSYIQNGAWVVDAALVASIDAEDVKAKSNTIDDTTKEILQRYAPLRGIYEKREAGGLTSRTHTFAPKSWPSFWVWINQPLTGPKRLYQYLTRNGSYPLTSNQITKESP